LKLLIPKLDEIYIASGILKDLKMVITQPRRVAAIAMAGRVRDELKDRHPSRTMSSNKTDFDTTVGYTIRFDDNTTPDTKIKYVTDGILVRECLHDPSLSRYAVVMLDEAHERSLNTDILFGLVKNVCRRRKDIKVLITSATLDEDKFSQYFDLAPVVRVPGRVFPVDLYHSKLRQVMTMSGPASASYVDDAVELALQIHRDEDDGHILIFLTGQAEIDRACALIRAGLSSHGQSDMEVIPLYSSLSASAQRSIFHRFTDRDGRTVRKCIVSTNIAETSITVPHVRYVVDCGYVKQKTFDPDRHMEALIVVPISQVSAQQVKYIP
jgi:HrpA-like RNA helicase